MALLAEQLEMLQQAESLEMQGTVSQVRGLVLRVADLPVPVGAMVHIYAGPHDQKPVEGEVVGFDNDQSIVMPLGSTSGIKRGDRVVADQQGQYVQVGDCLLGRVLDGMGWPLDGKGALVETVNRPLDPKPVDPLNRPLIDEPLATGVRSVDACLSLGRGQRIGVFSAPGLGKSTLLGMMARHTDADVNVIALVGERGREVRDFIENNLGETGMKRSVVVAATGDEPALVRIRAAKVATSIAEYFRDQGKQVLLIMDSVTRFCQAQRQVGLAAGEPPATKGYPPSVFAMLPVLLERSGRSQKGSITGLYAVLVEGGDMSEPIADASRGILDGHIHLTQKLADRGHWPAVDVLGSISRVMNDIVEPDHRAACDKVLRLISDYNQVEDLLNIGAYAAGSNPDFDLAIACKPSIDNILQQGRNETAAGDVFNATRQQLLALVAQIDQAEKQLAAALRQAPMAQGPGSQGQANR